MKNPADVAKKWAQNLGNAGEAIKQGVNAMTVNPAEKAAAQADVAVRNYGRAKDKMVAGLQRTTLESIKSAMIKKGIPRITEGAAQAQPKMMAVMQQLLPAVEAARAALPPRGSDAENDARMLQFAAAMRKFRRT